MAFKLTPKIIQFGTIAGAIVAIFGLFTVLGLNSPPWAAEARVTKLAEVLSTTQ